MSSEFAALPVHDEAGALEMVEGERALLEEVIAIFRECTVERIEEVKSSVLASDTRGIASAAHSIKGAAANICAERIRAVAGEIERFALAGVTHPLQELTNQLAMEFERFNQEVTFAA